MQKNRLTMAELIVADRQIRRSWKPRKEQLAQAACLVANQNGIALPRDMNRTTSLLVLGANWKSRPNGKKLIDTVSVENRRGEVILHLGGAR